LPDFKEIKINNPFLFSWPAGWLAGRLAGSLVVFKGILKKSYANPYEIQPAGRSASQEDVIGVVADQFLLF